MTIWTVFGRPWDDGREFIYFDEEDGDSYADALKCLEELKEIYPEAQLHEGYWI